MDTDFNNADIGSLPDLTGETIVAAESPDASETSPDSTNDGNETVIPEGDGQTGETVTATSTENVDPIEPDKGEEGADAPNTEDGTQVSDGESTESEPNEDNTVVNNDQFLSETTGGLVNNAEDLNGLMNHYEELLKAVEKPELLIPEGRARDAFSYALKFNGNAASANKSFHHILSLDPEALSPKDLQFEAYMLREENADLSGDPLKARKLFNAEFKEIYGEGEEFEALESENPVLHRKHELATIKAKSQIIDMQDKFQSETPENTSGAAGSEGDYPALSEDELNAYNATVDEALDGFDGVSFEFEGAKDRMNFTLDADMKKGLEHYTKNPNDFIVDQINEHIDDAGNYDPTGFANKMALFMNIDKVLDLAYKQGGIDGKITTEEGLRNPDGGDGAGGAPAAKPKETLLSNFMDAMNG